MLAASVSRTGTRFVDHGTEVPWYLRVRWGAGFFFVRDIFLRRRGRFVRGVRVGDGNVVVGSGRLHAMRRGLAVIRMGS
jgi:hypothetical protein